MNSCRSSQRRKYSHVFVIHCKMRTYSQLYMDAYRMTSLSLVSLQTIGRLVTIEGDLGTIEDPS